MTTIRKIVTSKIDGNGANSTDTDEIRPFGETAFYLDDNDKLTLMIFDGVRTHQKSKVLSPGVLYGSDADSGDGNNYDTIKLIPDAGLYDQGSQQYIIVDPTVPNHIHLRAGGTIDNSNSALLLGGENSHVEVQAGSNPPVYVRANSNTWMFDTDGSLSFPNNTVQTTAWAGGRVVEVPGTSLGATGDLQGDLSFDNFYMYYCTETYVPNTFSTTVASPGVSTNTMPIVKGDYGTPTTSWAVTFINVEYAITNVADSGDAWILTIENFNFSGGTGSDVTLYNGIPSPDIWKRVAWNADTW